MDLLGTPRATAGALEKVARLTGDSRQVPFWHHFSTAQRSQALWAMAGQPRRAMATGSRERLDYFQAQLERFEQAARQTSPDEEP